MLDFFNNHEPFKDGLRKYMTITDEITEEDIENLKEIFDSPNKLERDLKSPCNLKIFFTLKCIFSTGFKDNFLVYLLCFKLKAKKQGVD